MQGRSGLDAVAMAYAKEVYMRNEAQLQGLSHNLVTTFHEASLKFLDKVNLCTRSVCVCVCVRSREGKTSCAELQSFSWCWSFFLEKKP